ncbi:MAG: NAD-dependent epimerase/dehydratase family protein [Actinomycetota bacterium]|nr:NAD-dependent epimerase/dehydratase family protein [Actinomycetota bacterium]
MHYFVTGGGGFLGGHLVRRLKDAGHEVTAPSRAEVDLRNAASLNAVEGQFDRIFHLAAWTQAGDWCLTHPGEQWIVNQQINTNAITWWHERQPQAKFIAMGTSCSYAPGSDLTEDKYMLGEPIDSLYTYALTKRMLLQGLRAVSRQYGGEFLCLVPSTLYGPGYHTDGRQMHFIFDLVRKILRGKTYGETVTLWGNGSQRRELVQVDDFITNGFALLDAGATDVYNLGEGNDHSIADFAQIICDVVGYDFEKIEFDTSKYTGAAEKKLDIAKAQAKLDTYVTSDLHAGISELVDWFKANSAF